MRASKSTSAATCSSVGYERFDADYYARHYNTPKTQVASSESTERLAGFVVAYLRYLQVDVESVLDLGCGEGLWRDVLRAHFPNVEYRGVEVSAHMCEKHGWAQSSIGEYTGQPADLVVCQGVLQYLEDKEAEVAIEKLAAFTRGALYLEALTKADWREACDQSVTDGAVHLRSGVWYKKRLRKHFVLVGGGLFVPRDGDSVLFELERG